MAYVDNPRGFWVPGEMKGGANSGLYANRLAASQTITMGDMLIISSGYIAIAVYTSVLLLGIAEESVTTGSGEYDYINFAPAFYDSVFAGQCSGTPTQASMFTTSTSGLDIEGTTGIMEVNEDASSYDVVQIIGLLDNKRGLGANAEVVFRVLLRSLT